MDQSVIASVGSLLADEALWQARLVRCARPTRVTDEGLDALRRAIRATTRSAIRKGGVHTGTLIPHRGRSERGTAGSARAAASRCAARRWKADHLVVPARAGLGR